jgi:sugar lactone lactonase YvrE
VSGLWKLNINLNLIYPMKTNAEYLSLGGILCAGVFLLAASSARAQNMYVTDWDYPGAVHEYAPGSQTSTGFYTGGLGEAGGIAFNSSGTLFVADTYVGFGAIYEISQNQTLSTFATGGNPTGLAFNSAGDLFDADYQGNTIYEYADTGGTLNPTPTVFKSGLDGPTDLAFDSAGDLFESDAVSGNIYEFKNNGGILSTTPTLYASGFVLPFGLAFNAAGDLYVSYDGPNQGPTSGGVTEIIPGSAEKSIVTGLFDPNDIAFDNSGDLFVTDAESGELTEVTSGGTISSFSVNYHPFGIAFQDVVLPVPEPSTLALAGMAAGMLWAYRRRKL